MTAERKLEWDWFPGVVPTNVLVEETAYLETTYSFQLFRAQRPRAVEIGRGSSVYLGVMFDLGPKARVKLGEYVLMNGARIICDSQITIGDYSLISWNVVLMDNYRVPLAPGARRAALEQACQRSPRLLAEEVPAAPIQIGSNVWVGFDSCILPGVKIGEGSIVGARSVVSEDVPPYTIVAGNPARIIRAVERQVDVSHPT